MQVAITLSDADLDWRWRRSLPLVTYLLSSYTTTGLRGLTLGAHTLTFDLAESLVGESVGEREKRETLLDDFTTQKNTCMRCNMGK